MASCHGPTAPRQAQMLADATSSSSVLVQVLLPGSLQHGSEWEVFLVNVLSSCIREESCPPHSMIQIVIQVPSNDGSVLAACVHASVSALMDASIELNHLPVAITCFMSPNANPEQERETTQYGLDPTLLEEEEEDAGLLTMVVVSSSSQSDTTKSIARMGAMHSSGLKASIENIMKCWNMAQQASTAVIAFWRLALTHKHERHAQTLFAGAGGS